MPKTEKMRVFWVQMLKRTIDGMKKEARRGLIDVTGKGIRDALELREAEDAREALQGHLSMYVTFYNHKDRKIREEARKYLDDFNTCGDAYNCILDKIIDYKEAHKAESEE